MERKVKKIAPNITSEQIEQIRRQLSSAINAYGREVPNRYMYDKAVDGIKYKSSSSDELFVTVPSLSQKYKIKKWYLEGIQTIFNQQYGSRYSFHVLTESKNRVWIPVLAAGLATTAAASGLAIHFATTNKNYSTISIDLVLESVGAEIPGHEGETLKVREGTRVGELPRAVKIHNPDLWSFEGWTDVASNSGILDPEEYVNASMKLQPVFAPIGVELVGGSTTLTGRKTISGSDTNAWQLKHGTSAIAAATIKIDSISPYEVDWIKLQDNKLIWNAPANANVGTYTVKLNGHYANTETGDVFDADSEVKLTISEEPKIDVNEVQGVTESIEGIPYGDVGEDHVLEFTNIKLINLTEEEKQSINIGTASLSKHGVEYTSVDWAWSFDEDFNTIKISADVKGLRVTNHSSTTNSLTGSVTIDYTIANGTAKSVTINNIDISVSETSAPTITIDSSILADLTVEPESHSSTTATLKIDGFDTTNLTDAQKKSITVKGGGDLEDAVSAESKDLEWSTVDNDMFNLTLTVTTAKWPQLGAQLVGSLEFKIDGINTPITLNDVKITLRNPAKINDVAEKTKTLSYTFDDQNDLVVTILGFSYIGMDKTDDLTAVITSGGEDKDTWEYNGVDPDPIDITSRVQVSLENRLDDVAHHTGTFDVKITISTTDFVFQKDKQIVGSFTLVGSKTSTEYARIQSAGYHLTVPENPIPAKNVVFDNISTHEPVLKNNTAVITNYGYSGYEDPTSNTLSLDPEIVWYVGEEETEEDIYDGTVSAAFDYQKIDKYTGTFTITFTLSGGTTPIEDEAFIHCKEKTFKIIDTASTTVIATDPASYKIQSQKIIVAPSIDDTNVVKSSTFNHTDGCWDISLTNFESEGIDLTNATNLVLYSNLHIEDGSYITNLAWSVPTEPEPVPPGVFDISFKLHGNVTSNHAISGGFIFKAKDSAGKESLLEKNTLRSGLTCTGLGEIEPKQPQEGDTFTVSDWVDDGENWKKTIVLGPDAPATPWTYDTSAYSSGTTTPTPDTHLGVSECTVYVPGQPDSATVTGTLNRDDPTNTTVTLTFTIAKTALTARIDNVQATIKFIYTVGGEKYVVCTQTCIYSFVNPE